MTRKPNYTLLCNGKKRNPKTENNKFNQDLRPGG